MAPARVALIDSPILSAPAFFDGIAAELTQAGFAVSRATGFHAALATHADLVDAVVDPLGPGGERLVLVVYSGAGPLAPSVVAALANRVPGVVFLDAALPHPGASRLDELRTALPARDFERLAAHLAAGVSWPDWRDQHLAPLVPDALQRQSLLEMVIPRPLAFFEEVLPLDELPAQLPCAYLRLSAAYDGQLAAAQSRGWRTRSLHLHHFAPYTHPAEVTAALTTLLRTDN